MGEHTPGFGSDAVALELGISHYLTPPGECCDCGAHFAEGDTFTYRDLHFCAECISALVSWLLDGGTSEEPDQYLWLFPDGVPGVDAKEDSHG